MSIATLRAPVAFTRTRFETSRELEFFTTKELQMQIGFAPWQWPIALCKELMDNALDACETAEIAPEITVTLTADTLSVQDNGPGLPVSMLERSLNYLVRVSDKSYYVSPTRGQLGNALKCIFAAPYVIDGTRGEVTITTRGLVHHLTITLDPIGQKPQLAYRTSPDGVVKTGTLFTLHWPNLASSLAVPAPADFYNLPRLLDCYAVFNPHATFTLHLPGEQRVFAAPLPQWQKWVPGNPTAPAWYTADRLRALLAAYLAADRAAGRVRSVREVVAEFAGLSGTAKQKAVTEHAGLVRQTLEDLVMDGDIDMLAVTRLLTAMQQASRAPSPQALGVLGEAVFRSYLTTRARVPPESITYKKILGSTVTDLPYVLEVACGFCADVEQVRTLRVGLNWSPALKATDLLHGSLAEAFVDDWDPVVLLVHLACPRLEVTDRGKSTFAWPPGLAATLRETIRTVTKRWTALKRHADRERRVQQRAITHTLKMQHREELSIKQAAFQVMEAAYQHASGQGALSPNARQIMYAARPLVLERTGGKCWKRSNYFTQELLPEFLDAHPTLTADWDVVFDARGHLFEPHTGHQLGLGTLEVRGYVAGWRFRITDHLTAVTLPHAIETRGPQHRYQYALFIEKEGFNQLFAQAQIAERYDLALMSTKGMSVTAARQLVERLSQAGVTILVLHDFDKSGFSIVQTLRGNTRRYTYATPPTVIDLGLRLADVHAMGLEEEEVAYGKTVDPRMNLQENGATAEECAFLVRQQGPDGWEGSRVELNAMTTVQFVDWLEEHLTAHGVEKLVPAEEALTAAYRHLMRVDYLQQALEAAQQTLPEADSIAVPQDLAHQIRDRITDSDQPWDAALWDIIQEHRQADA